MWLLYDEYIRIRGLIRDFDNHFRVIERSVNNKYEQVKIQVYAKSI